MQSQHNFTAELTSPTLISLSGIGKAITEDNLTFGQRGLDHLRNVLRSRREHQRQFGHGSQRGRIRIQQKLANFFTRRRAARFARYHNRHALSAQDCGQPLQLSAFAASVEPFKRDEFAALSARGHAKIIAKRG